MHNMEDLGPFKESFVMCMQSPQLPGNSNDYSHNNDFSHQTLPEHVV